MAILSGKLFIAREKTSKLEVYDCSNFNLSRKFINVKKIVEAVDICACKKNNYIYIMEKKNPKKIVQISTEGRLQRNWETKDNAWGFLSATAEGNVILSAKEKQILYEYNCDGHCVRVASFP